MAGPYRNNVVVAANQDTVFIPALDALYVTAAPTGNVTMTVSGTSVTIPSGRLGAGTHFNVGDISSIDADTTFAYIGLRVKSKSGSANAKSDTLTEGGD